MSDGRSNSEYQLLQDAVRDVVRRVLQERGHMVPPAWHQSTLMPVNGQSNSSPTAAGCVFVAVCCDSCLDDASRAGLDKLANSNYNVQRPEESEWEKRAGREKYVANCDVVLLPALGDDDAAKMANGIFEGGVARVALATLAVGKPLLATIRSPYEAALKTHAPNLFRTFGEHRRVLQNYGFQIMPPDQWRTALDAMVAPNKSTLASSNGQSTVLAKSGKRAVITADEVNDLHGKGERSLPANAIITPLARDRARELGWTSEL